MNRKLILILVIAVALVGTMAFAMHSKKSPPTQKPEKAPEFTLEEMPALPHTGEVKRMDLKKALEQKPTRSGKTLTPVDPAQFKQQMMDNAVQVPFDAQVKHIRPLGEVPERALTECLVYVHDYATCCWHYNGWDDELWGWGPIKMKTWNDPQADPEHSACGYPIYPFAVKGAEVWINAPAVCTLFCSFDIQDFFWYYNTPYPGPTIYESPIYAFEHPGAYAYLGVEFAESLCVYDRYFVSWTFYNTDDYDPDGLGWCNHPSMVWVHAGQDSCIYSMDTTFECVEPVYPDEDSCLLRIDTVTVVLDYMLGLQPPPPPDSCVIWHQIWPPDEYCQQWHQKRWRDNGDGILSHCDTLEMGLTTDPNIRRKYHIEDATRTLTMTLKPELVDTVYADFMIPSPSAPWDTFYWEPPYGTICSWWHIVWPPDLHCQMWHLSSYEDNGNGYIDSCDQIDFVDETGGFMGWYHVEKVSTNITVTYIDSVWGHWEVIDVDTMWGLLPPYDFGLNVAWDQGGTCGKSYWSYGYFWEYGYWWDVVCDLPGFGMGWPGAVRIRSWGKTVDQNDCPILEDQWWQKEAFFEEDPASGAVLAYAPCGVPDFSQGDMLKTDYDRYPWDGPTALANCLWWMAAAEKLDVFWAEQDIPYPDDPWDPRNVPYVVTELADLMGLDTCGVTPEMFDAGLDSLVALKTLWVDIYEMQPPTWEFIEYNCRVCEDVILLLGFWYFDPDSGWYRIGGHWVTVAGVDHINGMIKISDPALNSAETGHPGEVCSFEYYRPHEHPGDPYAPSHFDAGNLSHDIYAVGLQVDPTFPCLAETLLTLVDYDALQLAITHFGHNRNPGCDPYQAPTPLPGYPIHTKIEFAKAISPKPPYICDWNDAYRGAEDKWTVQVKCNYGRVGAQHEYGFYWEPYEYDDNASAGFDGSIIIGQDQSNFAFFGGDNDPPGEFFPYEGVAYTWGNLQYGYTMPDGTVDYLSYSTLHSRYFHNNGLTLDVVMDAVGFIDFVGYGAGHGIWDAYTITNTGDAAITDLKFALWWDWDVFDAQNNLTESDANYQAIWCFDPDHADTAFGNFIVPSGDGIYAERAFGANHEIYIYPNGGWGWDRDTLYNVMFGADHNQFHNEDPDSLHDHSTIITTGAFDLQPGESKTVVTWTGEPIPPLFKGYLKNGLYFVGFFRGDVQMDCLIDATDIVYTVNYVFASGPAAIPFEDQGDCNNDGVVDAADIVYQVNYVFKSGPVPFDYSRFTELPFALQVGAFDPFHPLYNYCQ